MNPQGQQNPTDHTANFFWLLVLICLGFLAVWYFHPEWIVDPVYWVRLHEADLMILLSSGWDKIANFFGLSTTNTQELYQLKHMMQSAIPKKVTFNQFSSINAVMGDWIRWPTAVLLLVMAVIAYFRHTIVRFRTRYNMATLKDAESENWPQIQPVISLNLVKEDLDKGPWAMAKMPLTFCKEHNIVSLKQKDGKDIWALDKGPASRLFSMQLGPMWKDLFNLPIHIKALVVIFIARAERERDIANRFLSQISLSAASGKLDFTGVNEQLIKYQNSKLLHWLRPRHAYVRTMMATLLEMARADGVLATAEFLWLKPVDRYLWFMLNYVGRQTASSEIGGAYAHWLAEKELGGKITVPMVNEAVIALDAAIKDVIYIPDEDK